MSAFTDCSAHSMEQPDPSSVLVSALRRRLQIIADREWYRRDPASHLAALASVSDEIVSHSSELKPPVHPQLKHYLERCSYDKALAFLEEKPLQGEHHSH